MRYNDTTYYGYDRRHDVSFVTPISFYIVVDTQYYTHMQLDMQHCSYHMYIYIFLAHILSQHDDHLPVRIEKQQYIQHLSIFNNRFMLFCLQKLKEINNLHDMNVDFSLQSTSMIIIFFSSDISHYMVNLLLHSPHMIFLLISYSGNHAYMLRKYIYIQAPYDICHFFSQVYTVREKTKTIFVESKSELEKN